MANTVPSAKKVRWGRWGWRNWRGERCGQRREGWEAVGGKQGWEVVCERGEGWQEAKVAMHSLCSSLTAPLCVPQVAFSTPFGEGVQTFPTFKPWLDITDSENILFAR